MAKKKRGKRDRSNQEPAAPDSSLDCGDIVASTIANLIEATAQNADDCCDVFANDDGNNSKNRNNSGALSANLADTKDNTCNSHGEENSIIQKTNNIPASTNNDNDDNQDDVTTVVTGNRKQPKNKNNSNKSSPLKVTTTSTNSETTLASAQEDNKILNASPDQKLTSSISNSDSAPATSTPPKPAGSCCASKKSAPAPPLSATSTLTTACCGCGDNCRCCVENGWSNCQCGPNCKCTNPLMTEQASLLLACTNQPQPSIKHVPVVLPATTTGTMDIPTGPILATTDMDTCTGTDLEEANNGTTPSMKLFVDIVVGGMTCTMCSQAITRAMQNTEGVSAVTVSLSTDVAHIEFEPRLIRKYAEMVEQVQETITDIGYMIVDVITMMPSNDVAAGFNESPTAESGGHGAESNNPDLNQENLGNDSRTINTQQDRWNRIAQRQEEKLQQRKTAFLWSLVGTLPIVLLTMVIPHVLPSAAAKWWHGQHFSLFGASIAVESMLLFLLATPVQFVCGWEFYKSSYYGLFRSGTLGMDSLVALGSTASWGYALYATLANQEQESHFFETSAVLICFVLLGKWMQALAVHRTSDALSHLMHLQPSTAIRVAPLVATNNNDGAWDPMTQAYREEVVTTDQLRRGDVVKIVPGASLPADGVVLAGELAVDESMVTGESIPVLKTKSSVVLGGTVCVESSTIDGGSTHNNSQETAKVGQVAFCEVTGVGSSTALAQIIQLVQDAQASKVPMQNFADTVSSVFVPVVATLSLVTFLVWYALCSSGAVPEKWYTGLGEDAATFSLMFGIACLVISCPCALGLAVPTAIMVGTGVGAKLGVLMKGGEAFEAASQVNAVVLDKTGTVTTGKPVVTDFRRIENSKGGSCSEKRRSPPSLLEDGKPLSKETILWLLGSLERSSEHPLAKAIVAYTERELSRQSNGPTYLEKNPLMQPSEFRSMTGRGASGYMQTDVNDESLCFVAVGNRAFFATLDIELTTEIDDQMKELEEQGKTAILAAVNYEFTVLLGIADELKPDAKAAVAYLRNVMKIDVWMVTGDNARTAQAIARQLDMPPERVVSEALPNAKVHQVRKLQQQGKIVAHVGDGINDSPALAQANVGISMGTGAAIAAEASDMVLVRGLYVADVCTALDLSRVIFARIQWNLGWSLIYNCLGIPLAAGVFFPLVHTRLPPTVAAMAMALSSVSVVFSSLALRLYRPPVMPSPVSRAPGLDSNPGPGNGNRPQQIKRVVDQTRWSTQLVTSLTLEVGGASDELRQPLLTNVHLSEARPADHNIMEEGRAE
jgi:P-type Cu+ transporter